ncbi:MAG: flagellar biosynthesis protein FliQ [Chlamydiales bacterium]|nr:flagellar biosynthesis protein FliQ [Chlamydiales bacterium]
MTPEQITHIVRHTLYTALEIGAPFLLLALIVGLCISLIQSITQVQEMTLSFVPKMLALALALAIFFPWMLKILTKFTNNILIHQWDKVTSLVNYVQ